MMTLTEAVQATGKSKSTLTRAIKAGRLTATRDDDDKTYLIDGAELARVFEFVTVHHDSPNHSPDLPNDSPPAEPVNDKVIELLEQQTDDLKHQHRCEVERLQEQITDLRQDRDDWKTQASNQTLLLKHEQDRQAEQAEQGSRSWWPFR